MDIFVNLFYSFHPMKSKFTSLFISIFLFLRWNKGKSFAFIKMNYCFASILVENYKKV